MLHYMKAFLRDYARPTHAEIYSYEEIGDDYGTLIQRLADIFLPSACRNFHKSELQDRIQRPGEDITTYLSAIRSLGRNAYPTMPCDTEMSICMIN